MLPALVALVPLLPLAAASYPLVESWFGSGFIDGFDYPTSTYDNTSNGDVFWATPDNTSLIYVSDVGTVILKVDNTSSVVYNDKRYAPKLLSKTAYDKGTVWVFDAVHMPYGCSVWPAFWTQGPDWPAGGEIDIVEQVNQATTNQLALHTEGGGCLASDAVAISGGALTNTNCSVAYNSDQGCTVEATGNDTYGAGFAAAGGGVYVTEFAEEYIRIWFYTRSAVPPAISQTADSIDTSTLGTPIAEYDTTTCDIDSYFGKQTLTIDITLCGDWAGVASVLEETCPALIGTNTCYTTYVINDQEATYANAYFEINYINVYSNSTASSNASEPSGAASATTTETKAATASTARSTATGSGGRTALDVPLAGLGWGGVLAAGVAVGIRLVL
ncbi:hypothetical protein Q5752_005894 [Cryptotrichosporon argae]